MVGGGGTAGGFFEGVSDVAATGESAMFGRTIPWSNCPTGNHKTRIFDPRSGFGSMAYDDFAAPLGQPMTKRFCTCRHRLTWVSPRPARRVIR